MASTTEPPAGGGKILGLRPRTALIAGVVILGGALLFFWWKSRQSSSSGASSASASASAYGDAGQLDAIEAELDQLLQDQGSGSGSGSGGGSGSSGGGLGTTTGSQGGGPVPAPPGTPVQTKVPPGTTAGTPPKPKPATPSARETKVTANSVTIAWAKVPNATGYRVRVTYQGKLVGAPHLVAGTSATISGLTADRTYTFHVAAIGPGGTSSETNGPAVKTSR
jgi:hypothetical protein